MAKKPLVEVMSRVYATESKKLNPLSQGWDELSPEMQNHVRLCMTEVARTIGYFERRGKVTVDLLPEKEALLPKDPTTDEVVRAALDPTTTQSEAGTLVVEMPTGDPCGICGQLTVVRESSCRTRCQSCGAIDGGCG